MGPGDVIAERFLLEKILGQGGMGTVYRAFDRARDRVVAVKLLLDEISTKRFLREATFLADLRHPAIVEYIAHGTSADGSPYLAMEWLEGEDLASRLNRGPLPVGDAVELIARVADALGAVHAAGVVHRDIKPQNLFLPGSSADKVKILDFGVARGEGHHTKLTQSGMLMGTPSYMAPELARNPGKPDARVDVFSLGCVLFECLTGEKLWSGEYLWAIITRIVAEDAPRLTTLVPTAPPELEAVLDRMLAKAPDARFSNGAQVAKALREVQASAPPSIMPRSTRITGREQRFLCVVLSSPTGGGDETISRTTHGELIPLAREAAASCSGEVEFLLNGSVVGTFARSASPTDEATRAAQFALTLSALMPGTSLAMVAGKGVLRGTRAVDQIIVHATDLLSQSPTVAPGGIRIDDATATLLEMKFDLVQLDGVQLLSRERSPLDFTGRLLGKPTSCVGRDRELSALRSMLEEVRAEPVARAALVTAPAGMGKSRLVQEFLRGALAASPPPEVLFARADSHGAFALATDILRRTAGLIDKEPLGVKRQKLRGRLGRHLQTEDLDRVAEMLGEIAGVPAADDEASEALRAARSDPTVMGDAVRAAWEDWLSAELSARSVLIVLEDVHWGDLPSTRLLDAALRNIPDRPLMVLATARPEVHTAFPSLWAERGAQELRLAGVTKRASEKLVREVLGEDVDPDTLRLIVERAEGHPFYLEELIRAAAAHAVNDALPHGVLGMLQARFDALGDSAKRVLRAASVFGQTFWRGGVMALIGVREQGLVDEQLALMVSKELFERRATSSVPGDVELTFRHALVRDAAYEMLTTRDLEVGHRLAGAWLEQHGEADPVLLAQHHDRGGQSRRASRWYRKAAELAMDGNDVARAIELGNLALRNEEERRTTTSLQLLLAEAHYWHGDIADAEKLAGLARAQLDSGSKDWFAALALQITCTGQHGKNETVVELLALASRAQANSDAVSAQIVCVSRGASQLVWAHLGDRVQDSLARLIALSSGPVQLEPMAAGWAHRVRGERHFVRGHLEAAFSELERAREIFDRAGASRSKVMVWLTWAALVAATGDAGRSTPSMLRAVREARRLGVPYLLAYGQVTLGIDGVYRGDMPAACEHLEAGLEGLVGSARLEFLGRFYMSIALEQQGDRQGALVQARLASELAVVDYLRGTALGQVALLTVETDAAAAVELGKRAAAHTAHQEEFELFAGYAELGLAEALHAIGRTTEARHVIGRAASLLDKFAEQLGTPDAGKRYRTRPYPNARIFERARDWGT